MYHELATRLTFHNFKNVQGTELMEFLNSILNFNEFLSFAWFTINESKMVFTSYIFLHKVGSSMSDNILKRKNKNKNHGGRTRTDSRYFFLSYQFLKGSSGS